MHSTRFKVHLQLLFKVLFQYNAEQTNINKQTKKNKQKTMVSDEGQSFSSWSG